MRVWTSAVASASALLWPLAGQAAAQQSLELGATLSASTLSGAPAEFVLDAADAGFLTVVVRSTAAGGDLVLSVADDDFQTLSDARSDMDLGANLGAEQVVAQIPRAGRYRVLVESPYSSGIVAFRMGASFLPSELASLPDDPDGRPSRAIALEVGAQRDDAVDPALGDGWDWYAVTVSEAGVLTVLTRAAGGDEGDLVLEAFDRDAWREPVESSDQDEGGVLTNESLTFDVQPGQTVYVRVSPYGGGPVAYRIATGLIPG